MFAGLCLACASDCTLAHDCLCHYLLACGAIDHSRSKERGAYGVKLMRYSSDTRGAQQSVQMFSFCGFGGRGWGLHSEVGIAIQLVAIRGVPVKR